MALERELDTFRRQSVELKQHAGKFVLIHGDKVIDYFRSYEDAIKAGYTRLGLNPFLVKRIVTLEQPHYVSRITVPSRVPSRD